jgi:hypothetical protein
MSEKQSLTEAIAEYMDAISVARDMGETWASIRARLGLDCSEQAIAVAYKRATPTDEQLLLPDPEPEYVEPTDDLPFPEPDFPETAAVLSQTPRAPASADTLNIEALAETIKNQIIAGGGELLSGIQLFRKELKKDLAAVFQDFPQKYDEMLERKRADSIASLTKAAEQAIKRTTLQAFHPVMWLLAGVVAAVFGAALTYGGLYLMHDLAAPLPHGIQFIPHKQGTVVIIDKGAEGVSRAVCKQNPRAISCLFLPKA